MDVIDTSQFINKIFKHRGKKFPSIIRNKVWFLTALFNAAGSEHYKLTEDIKKSDSNLNQHSIFKKGRRLAPEIKDSFNRLDVTRLIDKRNLAKFLSDFYGDTSLMKVMLNFGIDIDRTPNKRERELFIEVLCRQFQIIIKDEADYVENIVKNEYDNLMQKEKFIKALSPAEQDYMISDINNLHAAHDDLVKLLILIAHFDFITTPFPDSIFEYMSVVYESLSKMMFNDDEIKIAVAEYKKKQDLLGGYLEKCTFVIAEQPDYRQLKLFVVSDKIKDEIFCQCDIETDDIEIVQSGNNGSCAHVLSGIDRFLINSSTTFYRISDYGNSINVKLTMKKRQQELCDSISKIIMLETELLAKAKQVYDSIETHD